MLRRFMPPSPSRIPWLAFAAEFAGTALLIAVGLSFVILDFGRGSPVTQLLPSAGARRALTGLLFGATGMAITLSWLGRESGAHINPVVTAAFWLLGKLRGRFALVYVAMQFTGAAVGALPLLAWGAMGRSVNFGVTVPLPAHAIAGFVGEVATTFGLIFGLFAFLRHARLRKFTPALFPFLYAFMVWVEAPYSGTSTNPARSFGPALIAGVWRGWWIYAVAPVLGMVLALAALWLTGPGWFGIEVAKLHHFAHDRYGFFHDRAR
jgi:aquaporin Z